MRPIRGEVGRPTFRTQRLRLAWLLAVPFLLLSNPTVVTLLAGAAISLPGLFLRALAAGFIRKERELATRGPYRYLRHPLYLGSYIVGLGLAVAGGEWWFPFLYSGFFMWVYWRTVQAEELLLESLFGQEYLEYRKTVPAFLPRPPGQVTPTPSSGFRFGLYWRNNEWQAALGVGAGFGLLWARMYLLG